MQRARILLASLGIAHVLIAIILLPSALFLGFVTIPFIVPGLIWLAVLGFRLWRPDRSVRMALRVTHTVLLPLSILLVGYGWFCHNAARRSAEAGGGLLGGFSLIPIVTGILAGSLSAVSLYAAHYNVLMKENGVETKSAGDA